MKSGKIYSSVFWIALLLTAPFISETARAEEAVSDAEMIQGLIDSTPEGEACQIPEGVYTVSGLSVSRPIKLDGNGRVTLRYFGESNAGNTLDTQYILAVWSDNAHIGGFTFDNTQTPGSVGIAHFMGNDLEISNNAFITGAECAGIISRAAAKRCVIGGNTFTADSGRRSFPMIQLGEKTSGALIKGNVLEGDFPDMLTPDFLANFMTIESSGAVVADNEFLYKGPLNNEDLGGFEDADEPVTREVFADLTQNHISGSNPWTRSMGSKINPETKDGHSAAALGAAGAFQAFIFLVYLRLRRRRRKRLG